MALFLVLSTDPDRPRKVPGRRGMTYTEADWIDDEATSHRGPDE
jgi:hypothetical protein